MKIESLGLDTGCPGAQDAKRIGVAVHEATELACRDKRRKEPKEAMWAARHEKHDHRCITGWRYTKPASTNHEPYWTYYPEDGVEVRIYDQENQ